MIEDQVSYGDAFQIALSLTDDLMLVARAADGDAGVDLCTNLRPDLVVCDYRLPAGDTGTNVAARLRDHGYVGPIALLTGFAAPQVHREAGELDGVHVMSKDSGITEIVTDLRALIAGSEPTLAGGTEEDIALSAGELEVLEMLNHGHAPAAIATELHLSLHTIRSRIKAIHQKLSVSSQSEAIAVATRRGLLVPPT